jgi:hypothetical protein
MYERRILRTMTLVALATLKVSSQTLRNEDVNNSRVYSTRSNADILYIEQYVTFLYRASQTPSLSS